MKYRLLMLSPVFDGDTIPEYVRPDVAEGHRIIEYESPEDLAALLHEAVTLLAQDVKDEPAPA